MNNRFFTVLIRNNETQEQKSFIISKSTVTTLDEASAAGRKAAESKPYNWTDMTVLEVAERLMGSGPPQIHS